MSRITDAIASRLMRYGSWIPDSFYLRMLYRLKMGYWPNLKHPKTFNEKLQWLKLHNRRPEYTTMVDKYAVKEYVSKIIGEKYIIPTLGLWDKPEDIDWEILPSQFVLKTTHGGGSCGVVICRDKSNFDRQDAIDKLNNSLQQDIYRNFREWPYKNVPRRILAEQFIETKPTINDLPDYKWYCFGGEPKFCQVIQNRHTKETIDFFDTEWNHQEFVGLNPVSGPVFAHAALPPVRPANLKKQIEIARILSKDMPFARIDLYTINNCEYFGEITLYPASGIGVFYPEKYSEILGGMLSLPGKKWGDVF